MTRRYSPFPPVRADCGYCVLEGPDEFGQWDFVENPSCPVHGWVREEQPERRVEDEADAA